MYLCSFRNTTYNGSNDQMKIASFGMSSNERLVNLQKVGKALGSGMHRRWSQGRRHTRQAHCIHSLPARRDRSYQEQCLIYSNIFLLLYSKINWYNFNVISTMAVNYHNYDINEAKYSSEIHKKLYRVSSNKCTILTIIFGKTSACCGSIRIFLVSVEFCINL